MRREDVKIYLVGENVKHWGLSMSDFSNLKVLSFCADSKLVIKKADVLQRICNILRIIMLH